MTKQFTIIDKERGIMRVTTDDERFYIRESREEATGLPCFIYRPSVTWIAHYAPKGIGYYKWLAEKGWDEAEAIKAERGKYGSRVHKACEALLNGEELRIDTQIPDPETGELKMLTVEEYGAVLSFKDWWLEFTAEHAVEVVHIEHTLWPENLPFAGSIDLLLKEGDEYWLIDLKTSQNVFLSHEIQLSAYKAALDETISGHINLAVLQIGYRKNKAGFKFNEIEDKYPLFKAAYDFWKEEHDGTKPFQKDLPLSISLGLPKNMSEQVLPTIQVEEEPKEPITKKKVSKKAK